MVKGGGIQGHGGMAYIYKTASHFLEKNRLIIFINYISILYKAIPRVMQQQEIVLKRAKNNENILIAYYNISTIFDKWNLLLLPSIKGLRWLNHAEKLIEKSMLKTSFI